MTRDQAEIVRRLALEGLIRRWRAYADECEAIGYASNMLCRAAVARKCADELEAVLKL